MQITNTLPWRLIILQFLHLGRTEDCTRMRLYIEFSNFLETNGKNEGSTLTENNPALGGIVWAHFELNFITWHDFNAV